VTALARAPRREGSATSAVAAPRPPVPLWGALLLAALSGPVLDAAFPDRGIWPLVFPGIALVLVALRGRRTGPAFLIGLVAGLAFYLTHIEWASLYLGPVPWIALSALESLFVATGAVAIATAYRWIPRAFPTVAGRVVLLPVAVAGLWTAREAISAVWPYGGFAWGRVSLSQSESPFAHLVTWLGLSGLSFVLVLTVALLLELAAEERVRRSSRALVAGIAVALVLVVPTFPVTTTGTTRVAAVQGNAKAGYFDGARYGDILRAHLAATSEIPADADVDMVVWPENAADADPLRDPGSAAALDRVVARLGAPLVVGTVTERDGRYYNESLVWTGGAATDHYDKKHPVPFGEYVPDRSFWEPFAPDLIGLIQREYTPGTTDQVMDVAGVTAGIAICFDIVDDQLTTDMVDEGAQIILAQSNNADFGRTDESVQQLAIARMRALETGRSVVNISTVGTSAIVGPDGRDLDRLPWFTAGSMVVDVPTADAVTPAVLAGRDIEWLVSGLGLGALAVAGLSLGRRGRRAAR
jgi:apolipoprotein N-acyltransferase